MREADVVKEFRSSCLDRGERFAIERDARNHGSIIRLLVEDAPNVNKALFRN